MPYKPKKNSRTGGYDIVKKDTGEKVGHSGSKAAANRSIRARNAGAHGWKPRKK